MEQQLYGPRNSLDLFTRRTLSRLLLARCPCWWCGLDSRLLCSEEVVHPLRLIVLCFNPPLKQRSIVGLEVLILLRHLVQLEVERLVFVLQKLLGCNEVSSALNSQPRPTHDNLPFLLGDDLLMPLGAFPQRFHLTP